MRVFHELTPECDMTTQMYAEGLEKKEIAVEKCRSASTINNQIQTAFTILGVRNRSELTKMYCVKLFERGLTMRLCQKTKIAVASVCVVLTFVAHFLSCDYRGVRRVRSRRTKIEYVV